ncbi:unnamed protein product [Lathyrus sativus]|nr:unnamed protein product [Lathyrus sativus]
MGTNSSSRRNGNAHENRSSFFFTGFPDSHGAKELYETFKEYRDIDEVVIPSRHDKNGRRYGFTRFFNVADERRMVVRLDNIFIKNVNLFVNIPRFQRDKHDDKKHENV